MGLRISFFKTPKHRVFNYTPIYYDERKERMQERLDAIEKEKAEKEGREWKNERYVPGRNIRGKMRDNMEKNKRHSMSPSVSKIDGDKNKKWHQSKAVAFFLFVHFYLSPYS